METSITNLKVSVRKALDDIAPGVLDTFSSDTDNEIEQAILHASISLSQTVAIEHLNPSVKELDTDGIDGNSNGYAILPYDYLRLVSFAAAHWEGSVSELIEPGSAAEKMQRSPWTRGTATKPKAMLDSVNVESTTTVNDTPTTVTETKRVIRYWPYTHDEKVTLHYVQMPILRGSSLLCDLRDSVGKNVIYLACRIFLEGKKENVSADAFAKLSEI